MHVRVCIRACMCACAHLIVYMVTSTVVKIPTCMLIHMIIDSKTFTITIVVPIVNTILIVLES